MNKLLLSIGLCLASLSAWVSGEPVVRNSLTTNSDPIVSTTPITLSSITGTGTFAGTFTGNGAGVSNVSTLFGIGYVVTPTYGTNPVIVTGAVTVPQVNGTYYYNGGVLSWTNVVPGFGTNYLWPGTSSIWSIGTNMNDTGGGSYQGQIYGESDGASTNNILNLFTTGYVQSWVVLPAASITDVSMVVTQAVTGFTTNNLLNPTFNSVIANQSVSGSNFIGSAMSITNQLTYEAAIRPLMPVPIRQYDPFYDDATGANVKEQTFTNLMLKWNTNGMKAAGWTNILISDPWCSGRDANGNMIVSVTRFPSGFPYLINFARTNGYALWIYTSFATMAQSIKTSCLGQPATTEATVYRDMAFFGNLGFAGVQIDNCNYNDPNPFAYSHRELNIFPNAMLASSNRMALSINAPYYPPWPYELAYENNMMTTWGSYDASGSISNEIWSQTWAINQAANRLTPGHWLYTGGCVFNQGSPTNLVIAEVFGKAMVGSAYKSSDISDAIAFQVATNADVQTIHQDPGAICAAIVFSNATSQVWVKQVGYLGSGTNAVAFVNYSVNANTNLTVSYTNMLALGSSTAMNMRDVLNQTNGTWTSSFSTVVQSNCIRIFLTWPVSPLRLTTDGSGLTNLTAIAVTNGNIANNSLIGHDSGGSTTGFAAGTGIAIGAGTISASGVPVSVLNGYPAPSSVAGPMLTTNSGTMAVSYNGAGLTNLNASQLISGTVPLAQLPGQVLTNKASGPIFTNLAIALNGGTLFNLTNGIFSTHLGIATAGALSALDISEVDFGSVIGGSRAGYISFNGTTVNINTFTDFQLNTANIIGAKSGTFSGTVTANNAVNINCTNITVNGSTSGTARFSMPMQGTGMKRVIFYCSALVGTATYTYPTAFTQTPMVLGTLSGIAAATTTSVTLTGTTSTGYGFIDGD